MIKNNCAYFDYDLISMIKRPSHLNFSPVSNQEIKKFFINREIILKYSLMNPYEAFKELNGYEDEELADRFFEPESILKEFENNMEGAIDLFFRLLEKE